MQPTIKKGDTDSAVRVAQLLTAYEHADGVHPCLECHDLLAHELGKKNYVLTKVMYGI